MRYKYEGFTEELKSLFQKLLPIYIGKAGEEIGTKIKPADGTPVTDLDNYALKQLRELIAKEFPNDYTIGEEDQKNPEEIKKILARYNQYQWTIDGLDGTGSLILGTNSYGAMISRRCGDKILYSAGFRPIDMNLRGNGFFYAQNGEGAWEWFETVPFPPYIRHNGRTQNNIWVMKNNHKISGEVKEQILRRIKEEGVSVAQAAQEHGLSARTIYGWLGKGVQGLPTLGELVRLKRQNEELLALVGELTLKASQAQKKN